MIERERDEPRVERRRLNLGKLQIGLDIERAPSDEGGSGVTMATVPTRQRAGFSADWWSSRAGVAAVAVVLGIVYRQWVLVALGIPLAWFAGRSAMSRLTGGASLRALAWVAVDFAVCALPVGVLLALHAREVVWVSVLVVCALVSPVVARWLTGVREA
jgi:hypothetical protein